jgi:hypothetical protein
LNGQDLGVELEKMVRLRMQVEAFFDDAQTGADLNRKAATWAMITALFTAAFLVAGMMQKIGDRCTSPKASSQFVCAIGLEYVDLQADSGNG